MSSTNKVGDENSQEEDAYFESSCIFEEEDAYFGLRLSNLAGDLTKNEMKWRVTTLLLSQNF